MTAGYLLWQVARHSRTILEDVLSPLSMRARHFGFLLWMRRQGPMSQQELAGLAGLDPSTVVSIIDEMEKLQLVERRRNPEDRRAYLLYLTPHGEEQFAQGEQLLSRFEDRLLAALDAEERRTLVRLLSRMLESR